MKKFLIGLVSVLAVVALVACGSAPTPAELPTEEIVLAAYENAKKAHFSASISSLPIDHETTAEYDGQTVYKVRDYSTLAELRTYYETYFSTELVDQYLTNSNYVEIDGILYSLEGGRGTDITKGEETVTVEPVNNTKFNVKVSVEICDPEKDFAVVGSEEFIFPYELVDGRWVFTEFPSIR